MIAYPARHLLFIEVRDVEKKRVTFSALHYHENRFLWRDRPMEEPWWINLSAATHNVVLFTLYLETTNPDKKAIMACDTDTLNLLWWNNDFSLTALKENRLYGFSNKFGAIEMVLDVETGQALKNEPAALGASSPADPVVRPVHYTEGSDHFTTVKKYLQRLLNLNAVISLEYIETRSCIIISFYVQEEGLANYLLVLSVGGEVLLTEKIGEALKGIGVDTFFVLEGCLIFVRNNVELVSYRLYD